MEVAGSARIGTCEIWFLRCYEPMEPRCCWVVELESGYMQPRPCYDRQTDYFLSKNEILKKLVLIKLSSLKKLIWKYWFWKYWFEKIGFERIISPEKIGIGSWKYWNWELKILVLKELFSLKKLELGVEKIGFERINSPETIGWWLYLYCTSNKALF